MKKHIYYMIELEADSPISLSSGDARQSDSDVYKNSLGQAVLPSSSLAGIYRGFFLADRAKKIFGGLEEKQKTSKLIIYDGISNQTDFSMRDGVALDENKTGIPGARFDREIVETGTVFTTYIEIHGNEYSEETEKNVEEILCNIKSGNMYIGGKQTRGYGKISLKSVKMKSFDMGKDLVQWLEFDPFNIPSWASTAPMVIEEVKNYDDYTKIRIELIQTGGISIRNYVAEIEKQGETIPDYEQLKLKNNTKVIPGTSWAGAFRTQYKKLGGNANELFGYTDGENINQKSNITFNESKVEKGFEKILTRNSIDRFSAGTKDGALFTERSYYFGRTTLEIRIKKASKSEMAVLMASILDLNNGFMAIGGLTAVGRGMFSIDKLQINDKEYTSEVKNNEYDKLIEVFR